MLISLNIHYGRTISFDGNIVYDLRFHAIMQSSGTMIIRKSKDKQKYVGLKYKIY